MSFQVPVFGGKSLFLHTKSGPDHYQIIRLSLWNSKCAAASQVF